MAEAGKEKQELKLPKYVEDLARSKFELRNDVLTAVINVVFKAAEQSGVYLNIHYIFNHVVAAKFWEGIDEYYAELFLDNGMVITATITPYKSWVTIGGIIECDCTNICEERGSV